jgi:hypothetical protein
MCRVLPPTQVGATASADGDTPPDRRPVVVECGAGTVTGQDLTVEFGLDISQ